MLYPIPAPAGFAFHVVEVMSSPRFHLKRELRGWPGLIDRARIPSSPNGLFGRYGGGSPDSQWNQEGTLPIHERY